MSVDFRLYSAYRRELYRKARIREEPLGQLEKELADLHLLSDTEPKERGKELTGLYNNWYWNNGKQSREARE